ncbi:MAG: metallophosphoesterase [Candidatus Tectomicrobia bacterium]|nr:metallophosphoesterase [Candidatus Tectomicrobia bacterium]
MNSYTKIGVFGGIYSNYLALEETIKDARQRGAEALFCLGDLGGFGPNPDKVFPILWRHDVQVIQGNYDDSIGFRKQDCACGYTDPKDNYFAQISFDYTAKRTSNRYKDWLQTLPMQLTIQLGKYRTLLCHGSPRRVNEFLWESTTSRAFLEKLLDDYQADLILCTHTGLHWHKALSHDRHLVNVGAIGRPANDGQLSVWYAMIEVNPQFHLEFIPIHYDYETLAQEMEEEGLPEEFIETIRSGWWTSCLEILPSKERARGKY